VPGAVVIGLFCTYLTPIQAITTVEGHSEDGILTGNRLKSSIGNCLTNPWNLGRHFYCQTSKVLYIRVIPLPIPSHNYPPIDPTAI
jgi:hypothetical protein